MVMNRFASHRYSTSVWTALFGLSFFISPITLSQAQVPVITNITPTTTAPLDLGTHVDTVGTITQITGGSRPSNGTDSGTNLFHSFDFFTLGTGDVAHFMNDMKLPTTNIIGRVIGGELSTIDGTLRTNFPGDPTNPLNFGAAHLWLVNPSGLLLGPNAHVEVGGSVSMSTANYLRFDGTPALFDMLSSPASLGPLSVAPVVAFGFLSPDLPAPMTVQGSILDMPPGQSLSLVGGDITVQAGTLADGTIQAASLLASGGQINLASVASPGEVLVPSFQTAPNMNGASFTGMGTVTLKEGTTLDVSGKLDEFGTPIGNGKGGTVFVRGGHLELDSSSIKAQTQGDVAGDNPGIDLIVTGDAVITNGSVITAGTSGDGRGGDITVNVSKTLSLTAGAQISSQNASFGLGEGGDVQVLATDSIVISGQDLVGNLSGILADTLISGDGGSINLTTKSLTMDQGGIITARTFGGGPGGEISVAVDTLSLSNGGRITSHTGSSAPGGHVNVIATDSIFLLSGVDSNGNPSGILTSSSFDGQTGNITLETSNLTLTGGSVIQSGSIFDFQGGNINVNASNSIDISNGSSVSSQAFLLDVGDISISTPTLTMDNGFIQSTTLDFGNAGNIVVNVEMLSLSGGARIDSGTIGSGHGGTVTVQGFGGPDTRADAIKISGTDSAGNPSGLFTRTGSAGDFSNPFADGVGGDIRVFANGLTLESGGTISAVSSSGSTLAQGGLITVDANQVRLSTNSTITSASTVTGGEAPGGDVKISAQTLTLDSGASASASTAGGGNAGEVTVTTPALSLNAATITTSTSSSGHAGGITANVGTLSLTEGAQITSASTGTASGSAGSVTIQGLASPADAVTLTNSSLRTSADSTGRGGSITVDATNLTLNGATISASVKDVNAADVTDGPTSGIGNIALTSSTISMTGSTVSAETGGTRNAGSIQVTSDNLRVTGGARIEASTVGAGDAGDITITNTDTLSVTGLSSNGLIRSGIFAKTQTSGGTAGGGGGGGGGGQTATPGDAGNIDITTNNLLLSSGAQIDSSTTTSGSGGSVFVTADAITITGASTSLKSDASRGNGTGGDIELAASTIGIHDKASVTAATDGAGNAGNISMTANGSFTLDSAAIITTSTRGSGSGGTIFINSPQVLVDGLGTSITASTLRPFADLAVTLNIVHPNDGDLTVRLDSPDGTRVALLSRVGGSGDNFTGTIFDDQAIRPITSTGSVAPFTGTFMPREPLAQLIDQTVSGTWKLNVSDQVAGTEGTPQSLESWSLRIGDQVFQSTNIPRVIPDNGSVSSNLVVAGSRGAVIQGVGEASGVGGDVEIKAGTMTVQNGATLSATTRGSGQGGTVNVNATGPVTFAGPGSGLFTDSEASGGSGNITITSSKSITLQDHALVSASSQGAGNAGSITIDAGQQYLSTNSAVTTQSAKASGGDITVKAQEMIRLINSQINTSVAGGDTTLGGNIMIDPQFVILQNSQILAQAFAGTGGNITIISNVFLADPNSLVDASSQLGISGQINIQSPVQNVGEQLTPLSQQFSSAAALLAQQCAARAVDGKFSTFLVAGREGLPVEPGGFLASPSWRAELFGSSLSGRDPHTRFSAVTDAFPQYLAKPIQLAKFGDACH